MGKPRMIIVVRHAQSEGNMNRAIHQTTPDHRVRLTPEGIQQAEQAGYRLRSILRPDDTIQFYVSPYRRTRETTEGILRSLTSDEQEPSPFPRHTIKVWEEPRLREQDFGNFQPSSEAMEKMWKERADYGHFFYRIPNGESAADAFDRISSFNESLWRSFSDDDCPSVCVLVTHGLMTRVFLMRWFHWSVEYFEDLRNVNHCEFVIMERGPDQGKYLLQNKLRTWSELKRRAIEAEQAKAESNNKGKNVPHVPSVATKYWSSTTSLRDEQDYQLKQKVLRADTISLGLPPAADDSISVSTKHSTDGSLRGASSTNAQYPGTACVEEDEEAFPHPSNSSHKPPRIDETTASSCDSTSERLPPPDKRRKAAQGMTLNLSSQLDESASAAPTPHESPHLRRDYGFVREFEATANESEGSSDGEEAKWTVQETEQAEAEDKSARGSVY